MERDVGLVPFLSQEVFPALICRLPIAQVFSRDQADLRGPQSDREWKKNLQQLA